MSWPIYFPENCPPQDAPEAGGEIFRFVAHNPPDASDFKTHWQRYPGRPWPEDKVCSACSVSVIQNILDAPKMQRIIKPFARLKLAKGQLNPDMGKLKPSPSAVESHHDWWIPEEREPWSYFHIVEIPQE